MTSQIEDRVVSSSNALRFAESIPFRLIGLVLAVAAISKLLLLLFDPFADVRVGIPKEVLWLSVAIEFSLSIANLIARKYRIISLLDCIVFAAFAIFVCVRMAMGYHGCGCLGLLDLPSWPFLCFDILVLTYFLGTPRNRQDVALGVKEVFFVWGAMSQSARGVIFGLFFFLFFVGLMQLSWFAWVRDSFRGKESLHAVIEYKGVFSLNQKLPIEMQIQNNSAKTAKIVGIARSCRCVVISENPIGMKIPVGESTKIPLTVVPEKTGAFHQRVSLFLDHPKQFRLNVDVIGFVKGES